ncbi:chorismate mutase [Streptomyces mirabilis]|uniref:chorismate mutase n=1 Tax=Streptomyces mirabilis TaxID=68239 RepID=UPI00380E9C93
MDAFPRSAILLALACAGVSATVACGYSNGTSSAQPSPPSACPTTAEKALRTLVRLVAERVIAADTVAAAKWNTSQPIENPAREKTVLDSAVSQAAKLGIDQAFIQRIFEDQITANKIVQQTLHTQWRTQPAQQPNRHPDLATEVRPLLDRVDRELLVAIGQAQPLLFSSRCGAVLDHEKAATAKALSLDPIHRGGLDQALAHICQNPSRGA